MDWKHYISSIITVQILRSQFKSWGYQNSFPVLLKHDNKSGPLTFWLMGCCSELRDFKGLVLLPPPPSPTETGTSLAVPIQDPRICCPNDQWLPSRANLGTFVCSIFPRADCLLEGVHPNTKKPSGKKMFGSTWTELGHSDQVFSIIV